MREILFRGKSTDTGAWVYGYYCGPFGDFDEHEICDIADPTCSRVDVDPETVGQYTGLTDKNGKQIFEGDIVRGRDALENGLVVEGYIDHQYGSFCIVGDLITHFRWMDYEVEAIGNVHDNPLLIGGKEDGT